MIKTKQEIDAIRSNSKKEIKEGKMYVPQKGFQEMVLSNNADIIISGGSRGSGKMMPITSLVLTPYGYRPLGNIEVGNTICNPSTGGFQKVIQVHEHGEKDVYKVNFSDGTFCECGLEHLWKIRRSNHKTKRRQFAGDIDADWELWDFEMIKKFLDDAPNRKAKTPQHILIPLTEPVKFTKAFTGHIKPPVDPYIIGALIGDGCMSKTLSQYKTFVLTTMDEDILNEFTKNNLTYIKKYEKPENKSVDYFYKDENLFNWLDNEKLTFKVANSKFIPDILKWGTVEDRFNLIQGLMDTDGYIDEGGCCSYSTVSKQLADDFRFVIESLGGTCTITENISGYKKYGEFFQCQNVFDCYIRISDTSKLFRLKRKKDRCRPFN